MRIHSGIRWRGLRVERRIYGVEIEHQLVRVDSRKYDGSPHRSYPSIRLGSDVFGTWLGVPGGDFVTAAGDEPKYAEPYVLLVPENAWWTAMFNPPPRRTEVYCDVTTPAVWSEGRVSLIDLDLDVRRRRDSGLVEVVDTEEFELHSQRYAYPDDVVVAARAAALWLRDAMSGGAQPFAGGYKIWLDQVTGGSTGRA